MQTAKFDELAAIYEFVEGMPRGLAEKRARAELGAIAEATISPPPERLPALIVEKIETGTLYQRPWLRLSLQQKRLNKVTGQTESRKIRAVIPRSIIDAGHPVSIGGMRWRGRFEGGNWITFLAV